MALNFVGLEMQKWNTETDKTQKVDEENGVIYLGIMFTPTVMVIKMSKMAHFLYFQLMTAKKLWQFQQNIYVHLKDLIEFLQKMVWLISFRFTIHKILRSQQKVYQNPLFLRVDILLKVAQNPIIHSIFWKS